MPGPVFQGNHADAAAFWRDGTLFDRDGVTPVLTKRATGWSAGGSAATAWRTQGNVVLKGGSSAPFCRIVQGNVLRGNSYDVMYRLGQGVVQRANGRDVVLRGDGLTQEELLLAALAFDKA